MSGSLHRAVDAAAGSGLEVRRAWPRSDDHLLLDLRDRSGQAVAAQWFALPARAARVAGETAGGTATAGGLVLQPGGADRRLHPLRALLRRPGTALVAHRPERRAVVRHPEGYTKLVRPERAPACAAAAGAAGGAGVRVPKVTCVDLARGEVTTAPLPGRPLHDLMADPGVPHAEIVRAACATGEALAALHASPLPTGCVSHGGAAELAVVQGWLGWARAYDAMPPAVRRLLAPSLARVRGLLSGPSSPPVWVHRDLHDRQVLVDGTGQVGLLDFDLAAAGEPALDLANLLVHLELRAAQGGVAPEVVRQCVAAVLAGYRPSGVVRGRLAAYTLATRLRLLAVYAFRPAQTAQVVAWSVDMLEQELRAA